MALFIIRLKTKKSTSALGFFPGLAPTGVKASIDNPAITLCIDINPELFAEAHAILSNKNVVAIEDSRAGNFEYPRFYDSIHSVHDTDLGKLLLSIENKIVNSDVHPPVISDCMFYELLEQIILLDYKNRFALNNLKSVKTATRKEILLLLHKGIKYIESNFLRNPQIAEIVRECNMSEFHFYRCFKQAFGITPYSYILAKRLSYSKNLLMEKTPVHQITFLCGFTDSSYYSKAFGRYYSKSPSKYCSEKITGFFDLPCRDNIHLEEEKLF